jgi:hypothetical protein
MLIKISIVYKDRFVVDNKFRLINGLVYYNKLDCLGKIKCKLDFLLKK